MIRMPSPFSPFIAPALPQILTGHLPPASPLRGAVIALGNFDGFHLGHRYLIGMARNLATASLVRRAPLAIMSVEPHPRQVLQADQPDFRLALAEQKQGTARELGLDYIFQPRFDAQFRSLRPDDFVHDILARDLGVAHVVVGEDFRFGQGRRGDVGLMRDLCAPLGIGVKSVRLLGNYSSSAIRAALCNGDIAWANRALARPWEVMLSASAAGHRIAAGQIIPREGRYLAATAKGPRPVTISAAGAVIGSPAGLDRLQLLQRLECGD